MKPPFFRQDQRAWYRELLREDEAFRRLLPHFILRADGRIRPATTIHAGHWQQSRKHWLFRTYLHYEGTPFPSVEVSTIFLTFSMDNSPRLFETMVFGDSAIAYSQRRCCTLDEAVLQHMEMTERAKAAGKETAARERPPA